MITAITKNQVEVYVDPILDKKTLKVRIYSDKYKNEMIAEKVIPHKARIFAYSDKDAIIDEVYKMVV